MFAKSAGTRPTRRSSAAPVAAPGAIAKVCAKGAMRCAIARPTDVRGGELGLDA